MDTYSDSCSIPKSPVEVLVSTLTTSAQSSPESLPHPEEDGPLDLSVPNKRPRISREDGKKDASKVANPFQAFSEYATNKLQNGSSKSPSQSDINSKLKTDGNLALQRMTELSQLIGLPQESFLGKSNNSDGLSGLLRQNSASWLNKSPDQMRDILRCILCQRSFSTHNELSQHIKETNHNVSPPSTEHLSYDSSINLPRKLVRGQDVWIGKGKEQTKQILKCMWCGESFVHLDDLTVHMQKTKHYTNIVSQEQIGSWKASDKSPQPSHLNAILTCKVCDEPFSSFSSLSNHMVNNCHFNKDPTSNQQLPQLQQRRSHHNKEKRKKALPVKDLLKLERSHADVKPERKSSSPSSKLYCETCRDNIPTNIFPLHKCIANPQNILKSVLVSGSNESSNQSDENGSRGSKSAITTSAATNATKSTSVLSDLEKLIQNFNPGLRKPSVTPNIFSQFQMPGSHDYSKPLVDSYISPYNTLYSLQKNSQFQPFKPVVKMETNSPRSDCTNASSSKSSPNPSPKLQISEDSNDSDKQTTSENDDKLKNLENIKKECRSPAEELSKDNGPSPVPNIPVKMEPVESPDTNSLAKCLTPEESKRSSVHSDSSSGDGSFSSFRQSSSKFTSSASPLPPLAALQQLCDDTDRSNHSTMRPTTSAGILAFSWACKDAVHTPDSMMKCAFCDTPFLSKGAYRHHLSKVHFLSDKLTAEALSGGKVSLSKTPTPPSPQDETAHSKFQKYSELAKQMSSKYV